MAVHRLRLYYSTNGASDFHGWLSQWLTNMEPWDAAEVTNDIPDAPRQPIDGGEDYYQTELAFAWSEDKAQILDNIDGYAASYCEWHRLGYHVCTHDESDPSPCSWENTRESGTVPSHIPTL